MVEDTTAQPPITEQLPWAERFHDLLRTITPDNLQQTLPQVLDLAQEALSDQVETLINRIPEWVIPTGIGNRDELNKQAQE